MKNHHWLEELLRGLDADKAGIKYGCAKALRLVSEDCHSQTALFVNEDVHLLADVDRPV
jgi:hypothetical protein